MGPQHIAAGLFCFWRMQRVACENVAPISVGNDCSKIHINTRRVGNAPSGVIWGGCVLAILDPRNMAQLAVILGAIYYAFASVWARINLAGLPPQVAAAGMLTGSTLITLPATLLIDGPIRFDLMPATWGAIAYYSIFATAGAYLLYYRVLAMVGGGNLLLVGLLIPPISIVLGAGVLGKELHPQAYVGFALLALGLQVIDGRAFAATPRRVVRE